MQIKKCQVFYLLAITYKDKLINCAGIAVFAFYTQ